MKQKFQSFFCRKTRSKQTQVKKIRSLPLVTLHVYAEIFVFRVAKKVFVTYTLSNEIMFVNSKNTRKNNK